MATANEAELELSALRGSWKKTFACGDEQVQLSGSMTESVPFMIFPIDRVWILDTVCNLGAMSITFGSTQQRFGAAAEHQEASMLVDPQADRLYLPTLTVPGAQKIFDSWLDDSAVVRQAHPPIELAYGSGTHETIDVFSAEDSRATVLFIHGGYWRAFYKEHFSYLAPPLMADGVRLAVMSYDLCPTVTLTTIVSQVRRAALAVARSFAEPLLVAGNSAGGHLTAMLHSTDWEEFGQNPGIRASIDFSGLHELDPLRSTSLQESLRLSDAEVAELSPARRKPSTDAPLFACVGALESEAFHWQAELLADHWGEVVIGPESLPGHHHFSVTDELPKFVRKAMQLVGVG